MPLTLGKNVAEKRDTARKDISNRKQSTDPHYQSTD